MRTGLRGKILLLTALPLAALVAASLALVNQGVSSATERALRDDLRRAADLFENMLAARTNELAVTGAVVVRDPRFFAVLAEPHRPGDAQFRATVSDVSADFEGLAHADVFEVLDAHGDVVASVGPTALDATARAPFARAALGGERLVRAVPQPGGHVLLVATPAVAGGRVVGALLLGQDVGSALAAQLRDLTKSDVTFFADGRPTRSTIVRPEGQDAAIEAARDPDGVARTRAAPGGRWTTLARPMPLAAEGTRQAYVLQRSFDAETLFLNDVRGRLAALGLVILLLVAAASLFIASHLVQPIQQLVRAAEAVARGRWDAPLDTRRRDELGALASQFDHMRERQRVYVENLEEVARAKNEFIAVASHELRTPIAVIRGWENLFRSGAVHRAPERESQGLDAIARACEALERIAVDATRMAQAGDAAAAAAAEHCGVQPLLAEAVAASREAAPGRRVAIEVEVGPEARVARLDRTRVVEAVDALVRNGIRFTPDGGSVRVRASGLGRALAIEVRDTGIGLSADARRRLAEREIGPRDAGHHHTAHGLEFGTSGLGFGLALARRVADAHGGRLRIEGEEGRGSAFTLELPNALALEPREEAA